MYIVIRICFITTKGIILPYVSYVSNASLTTIALPRREIGKLFFVFYVCERVVDHFGNVDLAPINNFIETCL